MCRAETGFAPTQVDELIGIVEHMTREDAIAMGQKTRAAAFVELAKATPAADTAGTLFRRGVTTPRGKRLPARATSTRAIEEATKDFRAAKDKGRKPRGRTTTAAERVLAEPCHYRLSKLPREALIALARLLPKR